jgi:hypothetical protein
MRSHHPFRRLKSLQRLCLIAFMLGELRQLGIADERVALPLAVAWLKRRQPLAYYKARRGA